MSDTPKLTAPRLVVVLDDGATWETQTTNKDLVTWDKTRIRQRPPWPKLDDAPMLWLTFLAWNASRRDGSTALAYAEFEDRCVSVSSLDDDDDDAADSDAIGSPTPPGLAPG